jgi:hypothetical protein
LDGEPKSPRARSSLLNPARRRSGTAVPFNARLYFFGPEALVGHLPIYGAMLVLLVYGSGPQLRPAVSRALALGWARLGSARAAAYPRT